MNWKYFKYDRSTKVNFFLHLFQKNCVGERLNFFVKIIIHLFVIDSSMNFETIWPKRFQTFQIKWPKKVLKPFNHNDALVRINPFQNKPWFLCLYSKSLLKTLWEKEKFLIMSNFSFSNSVFYPFGELSAISIKLKILVFKIFQF